MWLFHLSTRRHDDTCPHIERLLLLVLPPLLVACDDGVLLLLLLLSVMTHVISRCRGDGDAAGWLSDVDGRRLAVYTNDKDKTNDPVLEPSYCLVVMSPTSVLLHCRRSSSIHNTHSKCSTSATFERDASTAKQLHGGDDCARA